MQILELCSTCTSGVLGHKEDNTLTVFELRERRANEFNRGRHACIDGWRHKANKWR